MDSPWTEQRLRKIPHLTGWRAPGVDPMVGGVDYDRTMNSEDALFELHDPKRREEQPLIFRNLPIREDQITRIRDAFARSGIEGMEERRKFVEACVQRPTLSIRDLRTTDVRPLLERIETYVQATRDRGSEAKKRSNWDRRDGDTWIDRL